MKKIDKKQLMLILLIVLTGFSYFKMNQLTTEVAQLQWQLNAQENSIINQIRGIENIVDQIRAADRWYEEVEKPKLILVNDDNRLSINFKLMDYIKESKVSFHVKSFNSDEFITYDATDLGSGIYEIQLSEFGSLDPVSKFDVHFSNTENMRLVESGDLYNENNMEYYISVEHDDKMRTSETHHLYMYDLAYTIFQPINGGIEIDEENDLIKTNLGSNIMNLPDLYYTISRVEIQAYKDNKMVEWWELKATNFDSSLLQFEDTLEITEEYDSLYIEVKYIGRDETDQLINKRIIGSKL